MGGSKKKAKKPAAPAPQSSTKVNSDLSQDLELQTDSIRINLSNQRTQPQICDLRKDFNRSVLNRLQQNICQTTDQVHDLWQTAKTPKTLLNAFTKISDHLKTHQPSNSVHLNLSTLNLEYLQSPSQQQPNNDF